MAGNDQFPVIRSVYQNLTKSEQRIAEYIMTHPEGMLEQTIADVAKATGSSEITVSRFCKKLGYTGWQEVKRMVTAELSASPGTILQDIENDDPTSMVARKCFHALAEGLQDTLSLLDYGAIDEAARWLQQARRVAVYGFGNSATVAKDLTTRYVRLGLSITAYDDSHMQVTSAALLSPQDVVLAVSHSGASTDLLHSVTVAKECGAKVIALTSYAQSPLAKLSDLCLCGMGREVRYSSEAGASRLIHMAIGDVLYTRMAMNQPQLYQENMQKMRRQIQQKKRCP